MGNALLDLLPFPNALHTCVTNSLSLIISINETDAFNEREIGKERNLLFYQEFSVSNKNKQPNVSK